MSKNDSFVGELVLLLLFTALGYFVYGKDGAVAMFVLGVFYSLSMLIAIIPFIGCFVQATLMKYIIWVYVSELVNISPSLLTLCMFWCFVVYGIIITIATSIATICILRG